MNIDPSLVPFLLVPVLVVYIMGSIPIWVMVERRGAAWFQRRSGPNRVGPLGLLQPLADAVKLVFKEENIPAKAHKFLFILAPGLGVLPPFLAFTVIPLAAAISINGVLVPVQAANLNVGLMFLLAITSLHVYSILAAGWASNNKFSLMGALRSSAQMISYEIAIGICIVSMVLTYGTLDLKEIVSIQSETGWGFLKQPVCLLVLWVASFAECNRLPFDLPEGESELVAGYHTEYSGLKFALFMLAEYAAMMLSSAFLVTLFFGGYEVPFVSIDTLREIFASRGLGETGISLGVSLIQFATLILKIAGFMGVFIWVRWTLPRFRYDQLMNLGWKILLPIGVVNVILTMLYQYLKTNGGWAL